MSKKFLKISKNFRECSTKFLLRFSKCSFSKACLLVFQLPEKLHELGALASNSATHLPDLPVEGC